MSEWFSYAPDGREVVIRRTRAGWIVRCGSSRAHSSNVDVALVNALRGDADVPASGHKFDYPKWVRSQADAIERERDENEFWLDWQSPRVNDYIEQSTRRTEHISRTSHGRVADVTDPRD